MIVIGIIAALLGGITIGLIAMDLVYNVNDTRRKCQLVNLQFQLRLVEARNKHLRDWLASYVLADLEEMR